MNRIKLWLLRVLGYQVAVAQSPYDRLVSSMIAALQFDELAPQIRCLCINTLDVLDLFTPPKTVDETLPDTLRSITTRPPSSPGPVIS